MNGGTTPSRVLLKVSGEALGGADGRGIDGPELSRVAGEIAAAVAMGVEVAVVVGAGNFLRGAEFARTMSTTRGLDRVTGDHMGMVATVMNGLALASALGGHGRRATVLSAFEVGSFVDRFSPGRCDRRLRSGEVVVLVGGTGNPFLTTDTCASLRAIEIGASVVLKGTRVRGVYSADPEKVPDAEFFEWISFEDVLSRQLQVMDSTAFTLCKENRMPIRIFDMTVAGNVKRGLLLEDIGSLVSEGASS